jgi:hypothetical protein
LNNSKTAVRRACAPGCGTAVVHAEGAGAEGRHLEQPTRDRQVLHEVDELVLVPEGMVKEHGRHDGREGQRDRRDARAVADHSIAPPPISTTSATM